MRRVLAMLSVAAGVIMLLLGVVHSFIGWPQARAGLEDLHAAPEFTAGFTVPWHLAGLSMVGFGLLVIRHFVAVLRGGAPDPVPPRVAGMVFTFLGIWALLIVSPHPFFLVFLLTGLLVLVASSPFVRE